MGIKEKYRKTIFLGSHVRFVDSVLFHLFLLIFVESTLKVATASDWQGQSTDVNWARAFNMIATRGPGGEVVIQGGAFRAWMSLIPLWWFGA
jgi:hypothetical protein